MTVAILLVFWAVTLIVCFILIRTVAALRWDIMMTRKRNVELEWALSEAQKRLLTYRSV